MRTLLLLLLLSCLIPLAGLQAQAPLRMGVAGLTHAHVHWIFNSAKKGLVEIAGIAEPNRALAQRFAKQYNVPESKFFPSLDSMIKATKPQAVAAFNSIFEHLEVVQQCAPKGIHVMVEKPLAVSLNHALQMEALAKRHNIQLLTNYETTWYGSMEELYKSVHVQKAVGDIRKIVVHDGHQGPKEIGVNKEFLDWLTDPKWNGAGALMDFGCYGANLATWLLNGERPLSVTAVTQQIKRDVYPKVDDDATIVLNYPKRQVVIQASWNWPYARKDMEVYGQTGALFAPDRNNLNWKPSEKDTVRPLPVATRKAPFDDPFSFFSAVLSGQAKMPEGDLSGLANNMLVMEILDAAQRSAKEGKTVYLNK
jgi:predicted dehydrogenase